MNPLKFFRRRRKRRGMLTLEWILLVTVLVIGIIGGLGGVRDAINSELVDLQQAIDALTTNTQTNPPPNPQP